MGRGGALLFGAARAIRSPHVGGTGVICAAGALTIATCRLTAATSARCSRGAVTRRLTATGAAVTLTLVVFALLGTVPSVVAQTPTPPEPWDDTFTIELWSIDDAIIHGETPAAERLLREAQYTVSGMIYGFDFVYTPSYRARGVSELFELTPVRQIPWGDPSLRVREIYDDRETLYGLIEYTPSEFDRNRRRMWSAIDVVDSQGSGSAPLLSGITGKIAAIESAIKNAVRMHLRERYLNRPREARGSLVLSQPPRIRTVSGTYEAQVEVAIELREVRGYVEF